MERERPNWPQAGPPCSSCPDMAELWLFPQSKAGKVASHHCHPGVQDPHGGHWSLAWGPSAGPAGLREGSAGLVGGPSHIPFSPEAEILIVGKELERPCRPCLGPPLQPLRLFCTFPRGTQQEALSRLPSCLPLNPPMLLPGFPPGSVLSALSTRHSPGTSQAWLLPAPCQPLCPLPTTPSDSSSKHLCYTQATTLCPLCLHPSCSLPGRPSSFLSLLISSPPVGSQLRCPSPGASSKPQASAGYPTRLGVLLPSPELAGSHGGSWRALLVTITPLTGQGQNQGHDLPPEPGGLGSSRPTVWLLLS